MQNIVYSCFALVFCVAGYKKAWDYFRLQKHSYALAAIILCGLLIRVYCASDNFLHGWDERYHALVAKHLLSHFLKPTLYENLILPYDYKNWTSNHIWLHKQPMALWLVAISIKIFGASPFAVRIPSLLASTCCIYFVYYVANYLYDRHVAFYAAFLCSINGLLIELCAGRLATDHVDTLFLFFTLWFAFLSVKYCETGLRPYITTLYIALVMALLTKWVSAIFMMLIFFQLCIFRLKTKQVVGAIFVIFFMSLLLFLPWQFYIFQHFPLEAQWEFSFNQRHFSEALEQHSGDYFFHFEVLRISYGELVYVPVIYIIYLLFKNRNRNDLLVVTWFCLPFIFYTVAATKMPAYTTIAAPAIFMITAKTYCDFMSIKIAQPRKALIVKILVALLLLLPVRYCFERVKLFRVDTTEEAWNQHLDQFIAKNKPDEKTVVFTCDHPIELMFKTNCTAYPNLPDSVTLHKIQTSHRVLIFK